MRDLDQRRSSPLGDEQVGVVRGLDEAGEVGRSNCDRRSQTRGRRIGRDEEGEIDDEIVAIEVRLSCDRWGD